MTAVAGWERRRSRGGGVKPTLDLFWFEINAKERRELRRFLLWREDGECGNMQQRDKVWFGIAGATGVNRGRILQRWQIEWVWLAVSDPSFCTSYSCVQCLGYGAWIAGRADPSPTLSPTPSRTFS